MPRKSTPSFVTEIPLIVDSKQEKELNARFNAGLRLYNACLGEAEKRMKAVRGSEAFQEAKKLPKKVKNPKGEEINNPERSKAFSEAREAQNYLEFSLHDYAEKTADDSFWIASKLDRFTQQKLATRAFKATEKVLFGRAKKIRFKGTRRFRSMEGKKNTQGIRWKDNHLVWGKLKLRPLFKNCGKSYDPVIAHGLQHRIKFVRLVRREINGKIRWYAQLINEGQPFQKPKNTIGDELVGIDLNISNLAVVGETQADLKPFAEKVPSYRKEIAAMQRKMERSRRISNSDNYEENFYGKKGRKVVKKKGMPKKGNKGLKKGQKRQWDKSKRYYQISKRKRELERKRTAYAKSQNRKLVNDVLRIGKTIKAEKVSVKAWQKRYGKAIGDKSPGFVQSELKRKAENAGGQFIMFSTRTTALSQTHLDGSREKKSLSERVHRDKTGIVMHRDLFSAYLARFVNENDQLDADTARDRYAGLEPILRGAFQRYESQSTSTKASPESGAACSPSESIPQKGKSSNQIVNSCQSGQKLESSLSVHPAMEEPPGF